MSAGLDFLSSSATFLVKSQGSGNGAIHQDVSESKSGAGKREYSVHSFMKNKEDKGTLEFA